MTRTKFLLITLLLIAPILIIDLYLWFKYGKPIDITKFYEDLDYVNFIKNIQYIFWLIWSVWFLFIIHQRIKYIWLKTKNLLLVIIPIINIFFLIYILLKNKKQTN